MERRSSEQFEAAVAQLDAAMAAVQAVITSPADGIEAAARVRAVERCASRLRSVQLEALTTIERLGLHRDDGHASAKVLVRHAARLSGGEAQRRGRAARALRAMPVLRGALAAGDVGACQVDRLARTHANPRIAGALVQKDEVFAALAAELPYDEFDEVVSAWERLVDADGAAQRAARTHERRRARLAQEFDGSFRLLAECGSLQGAEMAEILRRYAEAAWRDDWAEARSRLGVEATEADLVRTPAQRAMDAVHAIFLDAAAAQGAKPGGSVIVSNLVIDQGTFERELRRLAGEDLGPETRADGVLDAALARVRPSTGTATETEAETEAQTAAAAEAVAPRGSDVRCGTLDGAPVDPAELVAHALVHHVRRMVIRADGVVIDQGRKVRLFTGAAQLAAMIGRTTCSWPGCWVPVSSCQIDHLVPWGPPTRGPTDQDNAGPACGRHNRFRERGHTVQRDADGRWHTFRPDGTEIL